MGLFDVFDTIFFGGKNDDYAKQAYMQALAVLQNAKTQSQKYLDEGKTKAQAYLDAVDTSRKSAKELYQEGREVAGTAAVDKAGIAKKQAKAASSMAGASKLFGAIQGAQAATDAVQTGYDEMANSAAGMAQAQENAQKQAEMNKALSQSGLESGIAQQKANAEMNAGMSAANAATGTGSTLTSTENSRRDRAANLVSGGMRLAAGVLGGN